MNQHNQQGEKCLLVRHLHLNNEISPLQFLNKNLVNQKEKDKQNRQIQEQLNKSQDNLSDVDIQHIKSFDLSNGGGAGDIMVMKDFDSAQEEGLFGKPSRAAHADYGSSFSGNVRSFNQGSNKKVPESLAGKGQGDRLRQSNRKGLADSQAQVNDGQQTIGGRKMGRNNLTSQNVHEVMSQYAHCMSGQRNICRVIDYEISEKHQSHVQPSAAQSNMMDLQDSASGTDTQVENSVYVISESYNLSLFDLYCTNQAEKTNFSEEFLIETSFQVLKALEHICKQSNQGSFRGFSGGYKGMLRMQNILFDQNGLVKVQDMSHLHFDEYEIKEPDLIFLPPEVLKGGSLTQQQSMGRRAKAPMIGHIFQLNNSMDVWTLGMILLHCMCLEYKRPEDEFDTFEEILNLYIKAQGPSLIDLEEKIDVDKIIVADEAAGEAGSPNQDKNSFSDNSQQNDDDDEIPQKGKGGNWIDFFSPNQDNDSQLKKLLTLKMIERQNYSAQCLDFLRECLMFDPKDRMKAFDLLSHPVFRKYNKVYISQQIVMTHPITMVEKHNLRKLRCQNRKMQQEAVKDGSKQLEDKAAVEEEELSPSQILNFEDIKINQLLDIIKIKVHFEKQMSFTQFLVKSFNQVIQRESEINGQASAQGDIFQTTFKGFNANMLRQSASGSSYGMRLIQESRILGKKKRIPTFVRVINKEDNSFSSSSKYGANLRFLREQNFKPEMVQGGSMKGIGLSSEEVQVSNFLILKSDLNHIKTLKQESENFVINDMKSIIQAKSITQKKSAEKDTAKESHDDPAENESMSIISDSSSVYSSASAILDSLSSIFSIRSAQSAQTTIQQQKPALRQGDKKSQKSSSSAAVKKPVSERNAKIQETQNRAASDQADVEEKIRDYLIFQNYLKRNTAGSTDLTVLRKMIRKYSDILQICKNLRVKVFKRLFNRSHQFDGNVQAFLAQHQEILKANDSIMSKQDANQIRKDIERVSLHPILKNEEVRGQIQSILTTFVTTNNVPVALDSPDEGVENMPKKNPDGDSEKVSYIQGIDTIASTLYVMGYDAQDSQFIEMIPTMLKQIYEEYSKHFLDPKTGHLDFRYSSILMTRLLNFFEPELANDMKDIDHSLYLIKWFMTLFAHTLPLKALNQIIWVDLFCERVDYLFFLALAILILLKDRLLLQKKVAYKNRQGPGGLYGSSYGGNEYGEEYEDGFGIHSLAIIQILSGSLTSVLNNEGDINKMLEDARTMKNFVPHSFISSELTFRPPSSGDASQNEYFARRWWEQQELDYSSEICIPLISVEDCVNLKKNKILVDVRPFNVMQYQVFQIANTEENKYANFLDCHVKNSYYMADTVTLLELSSKNEDNAAYERDLEKLQKVSQIQIDFLQAYRENYPNNLIIIVGTKHNLGDKYAQFVVDHGLVSKVCVLKGGIDAYRADFPQLLRKAKNNQQTENDFLMQYERFVKKSQSLKVKRMQKKQQEAKEAAAQAERMQQPQEANTPK